MARRRSSSGFVLKFAACLGLIFVACAAWGFWLRPMIDGTDGVSPGAREAVAKMSRADLEREVVRLQAALDERDRRLADLMIEKTLAEARP